MYRFTRNGISVLTVVDRRRKKKNGMYPIKIEVIYKRKQKYFPTGRDVALEEWNSMWSSRKSAEKCSDIEDCFNRIRNVVVNLVERDIFSFPALEAHLGRCFLTLDSAFEEQMERNMKQGKINSFYRYRSTLRAIERFAGQKTSFSEIDGKWLKQCEEFWMKEGKSVTTVNIYMKTLRCVCHEAVEQGMMRESQFPFKNNRYRIPSGRKRTLALTKEEIKKIVYWHGDSESCYWRDMWLFSYLCNGINFRDMLFLKYDNIINGEIVFVRSKTAYNGKEKVIKAAITPLMYNIMERSGNGIDGPGNRYIFKFAKKNLSPMRVARIVRTAIFRCNHVLKAIADDIGIPHFTTYSARHSFATVMMRSGVDIQFISESLGHSNISITEHYLAGFDEDVRRMNARALTDF